jgi:hypothetical protein
MNSHIKAYCGNRNIDREVEIGTNRLEKKKETDRDKIEWGDGKTVERKKNTVGRKLRSDERKDRNMIDNQIMQIMRKLK